MAENANLTTFTDDNFEEEVLNADKPVLVDFWATWCGPCRQIAPIVEDLADEFEGRAKVGKVDVDENPQTAQQFGVRSIPTLLFFKDGEVQEQLVGASGKKPLKETLEDLVGQPA
jgi:thioredoxin 1